VVDGTELPGHLSLFASITLAGEGGHALCHGIPERSNQSAEKRVFRDATCASGYDYRESLDFSSCTVQDKMEKDRICLPPGTLINGFRIAKPIAKGGFSLIYLAVDEETGDDVVVKEYAPKKLARRDDRLKLVPIDSKHAEGFFKGRKLFFEEAKALVSLRHPNIVQVLDFFLANNTPYLVMQYEGGRNLGTCIQERKGGLSTGFILRVFLPVLDALALIHSRSLLHLDVKPGNIHLRFGNDPLLLDFGAVRRPSPRGARSGQVITAGYSPVEQYFRGGRIGPWTDVYAVGASIRTCMEGKTPPSALDRQARDSLVPAKRKFRERYPWLLLEAVDWAMKIDLEYRPRDAGELLRKLRQLEAEMRTSRGTERSLEDAMPPPFRADFRRDRQ
jgi:serine/threonine protein kinase